MAISMKLVVRLVAIILFVAGGVVLTRLSLDNHELEEEIARLEAELGRMPIDDSDRVYLVEIEAPDVPPEVALHLERVWQFRCYLPPGYDVIRFIGDGRVAKEGLYLDGGFSSGWGSPRLEAIHQMVTVSLQKKDDRLEAFHTFGGSSGTSTWGRFDPNHVDESLVVQKIVSSEQGPRSFEQDTILPLLRIYDPSSAEDKEVAGKAITTYAGALFVLCPKSRQGAFDRLQRGEMPDEFDPGWIARGVVDE
jgi:hypothetical protein